MNTLNAEELLSKFTQQEMRFVFTPFAIKTICKAMDEYARQQGVSVLDFACKNNYISTSLPHEFPQLWRKCEFKYRTHELIEGPEITSEQLYELYLKSKP